MVGVPKSIGCNACRKQKKKCIVDESPPCRRCRRLGIDCRGYGLQRFIFKYEAMDSEPKSDRKEALETGRTDLHRWTKAAQSLAYTPSASTDILMASFIRCLDRQFIDPRYHLAWSFGGFLYSIPMHLGTNRSLDSAVGALVASYTYFRQRDSGAADATSLKLYTRALRDLRLSLENTEAACSPSTLSAIMVMMIVEALVGGTGGLRHAGGAAKILKCRGFREPKNDLECHVLATLRGPVACQALTLGEDYFTDAEWDHIMAWPSGAGIEEDSFFPTFSNAARIFQQLRKAITGGDRARIEDLTFRAWGLRERLRKQNARTLDQLYGANGLPESPTVFERVNNNRNYGLLMANHIIVNGMLASIDGSQRNALLAESSMLCKATCKLADEVQCDRPLGTMWVMMMLTGAYTGAATVEEKEAVTALLDDYCRDVQTDRALWSVEESEKLKASITFQDLDWARESFQDLYWAKETFQDLDWVKESFQDLDWAKESISETKDHEDWGGREVISVM